MQCLALNEWQLLPDAKIWRSSPSLLQCPFAAPKRTWNPKMQYTRNSAYSGKLQKTEVDTYNDYENVRKEWNIRLPALLSVACSYRCHTLIASMDATSFILFDIAFVLKLFALIFYDISSRKEAYVKTKDDSQCSLVCPRPLFFSVPASRNDRAEESKKKQSTSDGPSKKGRKIWTPNRRGIFFLRQIKDHACKRSAQQRRDTGRNEGSKREMRGWTEKEDRKKEEIRSCEQSRSSLAPKAHLQRSDSVDFRSTDWNCSDEHWKIF